MDMQTLDQNVHVSYNSLQPDTLQGTTASVSFHQKGNGDLQSFTDRTNDI